MEELAPPEEPRTFDELMDQKYGSLGQKARLNFHRRAFRFMYRKTRWLSRASKRKFYQYISKRIPALAAHQGTRLHLKRGVAITNLNPSGLIRIEEKSYEAHAQNDFIAEGEDIIVIGKRFSLLEVLAIVDLPDRQGPEA